MLESAKRPLFWFGHGIRLAGAVDLIEPFLEKFNVPFITSWQGKDMVDHNHLRFFGHAGIYGHRAANKIVQKADLIIAIGTRLALPQTGYDLSKFAPNAQLIKIDLDDAETEKLGRGITIQKDAGVWMREFMETEPPCFPVAWIVECDSIQDELLGIDYLAREDKNGYINSYNFCAELNKWLKPDQIIVTDMGTALLTAYPMLKLNGKQRLITSTGLGEMGFGLPGAIGASIGNGNSEVLCLNCDGGMMMNLQELATIKHHKLPIKIIVFDNKGYNMIRRSQEGMGMAHSGSDEKDLSFPEWGFLARAFDIKFCWVQTWDEFNKNIPMVMKSKEAWLVQVLIDPNQKFGPKVPTLKDENGKIYSPELSEMV